MKTRAHAVLHPEFLRKTKTAQNDSGTVIAWHIINLNQSLHIYQHFNAEIKKSKVDLHSTYHCGAGNIANSLKDPFYSFRGKKKLCPEKKERGRRRKAKESGLSPLIPEAEEPGPWIAENDQLLRSETFAGISRRVS